MGRRNSILDLKKQVYEIVQRNDEGLIDCCNRVIKYAKEENDTESIAFGCVWKAHGYNQKHMQVELFHTLQEASIYIDETKPSSLLEKYYTLWYVYKQFVADVSSSISYCLKALDIAEAIHDKDRISANLCTIGELYCSYECYEKALLYLEKALHSIAYEKPEYSETTAYISVSMLACYVHLNLLDQAAEVLQLLLTCKVEPYTNMRIVCCFMVYYSYRKDEHKTLFYANELLQSKTCDIRDHPLSYDLIFHLYESMMRIQKTANANEALTMLRQGKMQSHVSTRLKLAMYQIAFDEYVDAHTLYEDYVAYYQSYMEHETYLEQEKIKALNTKIELHEVQLENDRKKTESAINEIDVYQDSVTKLYNRAFFHYKQTQVMHDPTYKNISCILIDIDYFREYAIAYGASKSEETLMRIAHLLEENRIKNMDVCRYDHDQFACLCYHVELEELKRYIDKVRLDLFHLYIEHKSSLCSDRISVSIGYGMHSLPLEHPIFLFVKDVEQALHHAKKNGRNHVVQLQYGEDSHEDEHIYVSKTGQVLQLTKDIKDIRFQDLELLKQKCDSLAALSEKYNDVYGMTFSHMYLAHYFQINQHDDAYKFHSEMAKKLSLKHGFSNTLIEYYKLACIYYTETGDELSSFSSCLQGLTIATQAYDYEACTAFYNNIAEAFFQSCEYDKAEVYYLKALKSTTYSQDERPRYKDLVLMNIVDVFVKKKDIVQAKYWLSTSQTYGQDTSLIASYLKRSEICILILEHKYEEAFEEIKKIRKELESEEPMLFIHVYIYLMEALLDMKQKEYADWCLHILLSLSNDVNMQFQLQIYGLQIQYCELFQMQDRNAYEIFYKTSLLYKENEMHRKCDSLHMLLKKHNAAISQEKMLVSQDKQVEVSCMDDVTGVYNRDFFEKTLTKFMYSDTVKTIGVMIVDLDYFKEYNDTYGYQKGDEILRTVAKILSSNLCDDGLLFRYGQDEFACLYINKSEEDIITLIEEIRSELKNMQLDHRTHKSNPNKYVTLSFGFYNGSKQEHVLDKAEDALLKAKTIGRDTYYPRRVKPLSVRHEMLSDNKNEKEKVFVEEYKRVLKAEEMYALVQINIKNFRYYNTKYGYKQGDEIVSLVYDELLKWVQGEAYVTHMYADNYAMLVACDNIEELQERLWRSIDQLENIKDPRIHRNIFFTYGVYVLKDKTVPFQEAWNAANVTRKETSSPSKRSSSIGVYKPSYEDDFLARIQLEEDTAEAYKNYEFVPFYQPKVDTKTHEIIGGEALLRWYDDKGNLVPLYKFLPILNENSYINHIDLAIFDTTCQMLDERVKEGRPVVPISFNISKSYFYEDSIVEDYIRVFEKYNIAKDLIEIELMETISLDDTARLKKVIQGFNDYGFKCLLDDFGNGYSSFNVLLNNELSAVKIDRQFFVKNLNGDNKLIIETVVNLIKSLHMKVVAEGVETKEYADFLADCGCDAIQGYYFYKPMPLKKFCALINRVK